MDDPFSHDAPDRWARELISKFRDVTFLTRGDWVAEPQVDDVETLLTTIDMAAARMGATAAIWAGDGGYWCWLFRAVDRQPRLFPNKEAAEMLAIHNV